MRKTSTAILAFITLISLTTAFGQQPKAQEQSVTKAPQSAAKEAKKPAVLPNPTALLTSARNVFIVRTHGSKIPYDTIRTTVDNWERFTLVDADVAVPHLDPHGGVGPRLRRGGFDAAEEHDRPRDRLRRRVDFRPVRVGD